MSNGMNPQEKIIRDLTQEVDERMEQEYQDDLNKYKDFSAKEIIDYLETSLKQTDLIADALNLNANSEFGAILLNALNENRFGLEASISWISSKHVDESETEKNEVDLQHDDEL